LAFVNVRASEQSLTELSKFRFCGLHARCHAASLNFRPFTNDRRSRKGR
jgi:hypothetical protein